MTKTEKLKTYDDDSVEKADGTLRKATLAGVCASIREHFSSKKISIEDFMSLSDADFKAAHSNLLDCGKKALDSQLQKFKGQGIGRMFFDQEFRPRVVTSKEVARKYETVCFSRKEAKKYTPSPLALKVIWQARMKLVG